MPVGTLFEIEVPRPVASSKNRRRTFIQHGRVVSLPSKQASDDMKLMRQLAIAARGSEQMFDDDDILELDVRHHLERDTLTIRVTKIGRMGAGKRGTRRDCHGMIDTVADALQGIWYADDRTIDGGTWSRIRSNLVR